MTVPSWPNGAKVAVALTFDVDSESTLLLDFPDRAHRMVGPMSFMRYDSIAIPAILKLYREHEMTQTFFMPAWVMERHPELVDSILHDGHEIAAHGYLHEAPGTLEPADEEYWMGRAIDTHVKLTGQRPRGYRAPVYNFSDHTARILGEEGFLYDSSLMADHDPYLIDGGSGTVVELPTHFALDDWPQYTHLPDYNYMMPINSPGRAADVFLSEFDAAWEDGGLWISVWHPFVSGRPARLKEIGRMISHMKDRGDVWFAPLEMIARHLREEVDSGGAVLRTDRLPYYKGPLGGGDSRAFSAGDTY
ncbi:MULTISPECIES: polysaccharide deacetylase family protein [unclassified Nocardioides]|uniref:polysaccharide deacetylase family protein n=1 Tax=unclassified Nocardioides TaxID=2615069 RepID=UPI0009EFA5E2|nr:MULTISPECIES: polysaccharide deacetylase [unclassified Nocardioides]GAW48994.1 Putative xylanase/chitin deacetylase [Nocardioides sp. PD653-B2]GAW55209.1 putative xylanase/chitin deacetylase [Nocardioides sp. PD653]